ncbi:MAG: type II toxin-antitoxin system RelE/ParE family toxin [Pseudomonadota bacterium]|nr:type II toxin-antitoxin system RelE/ParE family toxin [Pseudomonadota bacterium]
MSHKVIVLDLAKPDFREIRSHVQKDFGDIVWNEVNLAFKDMFRKIGARPENGKEMEELRQVGKQNFRFRMVGQTKIVYEFNDTEVLVHMFIHTRRDFRTHLMNRLVNS